MKQDSAIMNLPVEERRRSIAARHPRWEEWTLYTYFEQAADRFSQRDLVVTDEETQSYASVFARTEQLAAGLSAQNLAPGSRIGLVMANYPDVICLLFAIWRLGHIAIPINTNYRADELHYVLRQSRCNFLVSMAAFRNHDYLSELDEIMPQWRSSNYGSLVDLQGIAIFGGGEDVPLRFDQLLGNIALAPVPADRSAHSPAIIMYTSGTTGGPKGVLLTHDNLLRGAYTVAYHHGFEDGRRALFSLPLYHSYGIVQGLLAGLITGGSIIPLLEFSAPEMLTAIGRHRANYLMVVPTMMLALLHEARQGHYNFSSLTAIHNAAAATPMHIWNDIRQTFGCDAVFTSYGQTETTALIIGTQPGDSVETVATTQGVPAIAGIAAPEGFDGRVAQFKLLDPVTGTDCADGEAGEICTRGPLNCAGYFESPDETAKIYTPDRWLRTGDLGRFRDDGYLVLTGRLKDQYKSGGELVSPKEVEDALTAHSDVSQAHVLGVPDDKWGEIGVAWIVPEIGRDPAKEELHNFLKTRLAPFKRPRMIIFIAADALPKTATGKVQKKMLLEKSCELYRDSKADA